MAQPNISRRAAKYSSGSNLPIRRIVIHATCGGRGYPAESAAGVAEATARYFQSTAAGGSAHYVCDIASEEHTLPDDAIAWHAPPNPNSIGVEICADGGQSYGKFRPYSRQQWLSPLVWPAVERAARRVRELAARHEVPLRRLTPAQVRAGFAGICGHTDVSEAFGETDHTDPGPTFPWQEFMTLLHTDEKDDDMPAPVIVSVGVDAAVTIPASKSVAITWGKEWVDPAKLHSEDGKAILPNASYWCICDALIRLSGLEPGAAVDIAWTRYSRDGKTVSDDAWIVPTRPAGDDGKTTQQMTGQFAAGTDVQIRVRVHNALPYPIAVSPGSMAKLTLMRR